MKPWWMMGLIWAGMVMAPSDEGAGAGGEGGPGSDQQAGPGEGAGTGGTAQGAGAGGDAGGAASDGQGSGAADGGSTPSSPWWESWDAGGDEELKTHVLNAGYHKGTESLEAALTKVAAAARNAERKLGRPSDQLMTVPDKDVDRAEWRRANAAALDIPEDPSGYAIERPAEMPEGMPWDEAEAKETAEAFHKLGVPKDLAAALIRSELEKRVATWNEVSQEIADAQRGLREKLTAEWGGQVQGNMALATRALHHFGSQAGLPAESLQAVQRKMIGEGGIEDAQLVRLFHAIGKAMGEDGLVGAELTGPGSAGGAMTPAEAKARSAQITAPNGDYAKARASGDRARMRDLDAEISRLAKIQAEGAAA